MGRVRRGTSTQKREVASDPLSSWISVHSMRGSLNLLRPGDDAGLQRPPQSNTPAEQSREVAAVGCSNLLNDFVEISLGEGDWPVAILEGGQLNVGLRATVSQLHLVAPSVTVRGSCG